MELQKKIMETSLTAARVDMQPHIMYGCVVTQIGDTGKFKCFSPRFMGPDPDEDDLGGDEYGTVLFALGDTPAMATENFDNLWLYGKP